MTRPMGEGRLDPSSLGRKAALEEGFEHRRVVRDAKTAVMVLDVQRRAEVTLIADKEVRRPDDAPLLAFMPVADNRGRIGEFSR